MRTTRVSDLPYWFGPKTTFTISSSIPTLSFGDADQASQPYPVDLAQLGADGGALGHRVVVQSFAQHGEQLLAAASVGADEIDVAEACFIFAVAFGQRGESCGGRTGYAALFTLGARRVARVLSRADARVAGQCHVDLGVVEFVQRGVRRVVQLRG